MSKAVAATNIQIQFLDADDAKITMEAEGASTVLFRGDDGSEIGHIKNVTVIPNHVDASSSPFAVAASSADRIHIENSNEVSPFYVDLPDITTVAEGRTFRIKDSLPNAGSFPIHIRPNGSDTIEGASEYILNNDWIGVTMYRKGTKWIAE